ncbi:hypothetical protein [Thalassotalea aquiviva]|uniref:hypothetical protein n=1 Tax=Thalassotalea aquiviva TaxID=3242415 RepID=UPI00352ACAA2
MQTIRYVKYSIISVVSLLVLYLFVDQVFIRGRHVETYDGTVLRAWDNTDLPGGRARINVYQAQVKLSNGAIVNIICQRACIEDQAIKIDKFQPLAGWSENYYSGI